MDRLTLIIAGGVGVALFGAVLVFPEVKISPRVKTDAEIALAEGRLSKDDARAVQTLREAHIFVTLAQLEAAKTDAAGNGAEARYAAIAPQGYEAVNPRDDDRKPHKALCYSLKTDRFRSHDIVYYNDDHFYQMQNVPLANWIRSGCAEAVAASRDTSSRLTYMRRIGKLVPSTESYRWVRASIDGNAYMICQQAPGFRNLPVRQQMAQCPTPRSS
ncbi:hypothetical protein [Asticcacaulis sp. YBE204]|uniref:hypothetical protein n=1 Tax=Asticcacaulis sp. YBE204 TaxID=1282363 RepID=UPI0003C3B541|nr:hypothetical protein [Asticcacaulis sp. YBE204]ESQ79498.1 hypothetical protein AEYBE204_06555 [Asticcacaulis sp. YBE204]